MGIDSYFVIGAAHAAAGDPCQDYAFHGAGFGVIADGCSSSTGRPDLGARLAASALARALAQPVTDTALPQRTLLEGLASAMASGLATREDLLTTVGGFRVDESGIQAWLWGDGVMYVEYADGSSDLKIVEWADNTPMYPVYLLDPEPPQLLATVNGEPIGAEVPIYWDLRGSGVAPVRTFVLATDGMLQLSGIPVQDALSKLTAFKTVEGSFLKRRARRALKTMAPIDDLGMVAYHETIR